MHRIALFALVATAAFCFVVGAPQVPGFPEGPPCEVNEAKYPCGKRCEDKCNEKKPDYCNGGLQCLGFSCRCKDGHARHPITHACVLKKDCPAKPCAEGETKGNCGKACEATCDEQTPPEICQRLECNPNIGDQCRCDFQAGYVRNTTTKNCVLVENCRIQWRHDEDHFE